MLFGKETEVHHSCSVTYRNRFYVFGGDQHKRQISEVTKCELTRIGNLDFDHHWGSCSSVNDQEIYLCFDWSNTYQCRSADDPLGRFTEIAPSIYPHRLSRTAASKSSFFLLFSFLSPFVGELLAVGSSKWNHVKTEMYLTEVGRWYKLDDFPFDWESKMIFFFFCLKTFLIHKEAKRYLYHYAALYQCGSFYLFGGRTRSSSYSNTIARLDTKTTTWSKVGC